MPSPTPNPRYAARATPRIRLRVKLTPAGLVVGLVALAGAATLAPRILPPASAARPATLAASSALIVPAAGPLRVNETFDTLDNWLFPPSAGDDYGISLDKGEYIAEVRGTALRNYYEQGEFDSGVVEVDARWLDGDDDPNARMGLILRQSDAGAYFFEYYPFLGGAWMFQLGEESGDQDSFETLGEGVVDGAALRDARAVQHLRVDLEGGMARLYVNDIFVREVDADQLDAGQVGLVATASAGKRVRMGFDNFTVRELK